jgi:predicted O-methyltransferase YrrM
MNLPPPDKAFFDEIEGMISAQEAALLYRLAAKPRAGCIVEIGSWRGKSAIAMALGVKTLPADKRQPITCIEPHAEYTGVLGGKFGPKDREAFFKAVLDADCAQEIALVNLSSTAAARAWTKPIGLLFIDGDHSEEGVQADVDAWAPFLTRNGVIVFDDAKDETIGPARVVERMLASGEYQLAKRVGKIAVLRKTEGAMRAGARRAKQTAAQSLRPLAEQAGYDPETTMARLKQNSFASLAHRYLYVSTPKAACTSMKAMVAGIEGASLDRGGRPYQRETRREMRIHERKYLGISTFLDIPEEDRENILARRDGWFVFALVRNPFSRLVSVFENKIRLGEPGYGAFEERFGDRGPFADTRAAFAGFVQEVIGDADQREANPHFSAQTGIVMPRLIPYSAVFKLEEIEKALSAFRAHLTAHGFSGEIRLPSMNVSVTNSWRSYYDEPTARRVAEIYAGDFREFGYDPEDWRGGQAFVPETESERRWRTEVVERNAVINDLYDWLKKSGED